jgi:hypothetical protein
MVAMSLHPEPMPELWNSIDREFLEDFLGQDKDGEHAYSRSVFKELFEAIEAIFLEMESLREQPFQ